MGTCTSCHGAGALWTRALCTGQWQKKGGLTLTCQKTKYQTHSHSHAECPGVDEHLVADPRNDKAEVVTFRHQACRGHQRQKTPCASVAMLSVRAIQEQVSSAQVVYIPLSCSRKPCRHVGGEGRIPRSSLAYFNPSTPG